MKAQINITLEIKGGKIEVAGITSPDGKIEQVDKFPDLIGAQQLTSLTMISGQSDNPGCWVYFMDHRGNLHKVWFPVCPT